MLIKDILLGTPLADIYEPDASILQGHVSSKLGNTTSFSANWHKLIKSTAYENNVGYEGSWSKQ